MNLKELIKKFIPDFLINFYHYSLAATGAFFYGYPSEKIKVIGITGTKGKSTVVELTTKILENAGYKVASISSIRFKIGKKQWQNKLKMAMPGRFKIQRFLKRAVKENCQYAILEVSSEGIKQHRHRFIDFDIAIFTNLSPEHIESHKGFENYRKAKLKLFKITKNIHIINLDDENTKWFLKYPAKKKYGFTVKQAKCYPQESPRVKIIKAEDILIKSNGISFNVQNVKFNLNLLGEFNIYNTLAAISVGLSQGISLETCKKALEKIKKIPGRMEVVIKKPFTVIIDYAHTPDSLEKVYKTLNSVLKNQSTKIICLLGACGGGRDKWKRPVLGKIASQYCDKIIITNEDPYDEDPNQILSMLKSGIIKAKYPKDNFFQILDRRKAIKKALELAKINDIVIITGKGSEPWICLKNGKKIPWDDRKIVRQEFQKLKQYEKI